MPATIDRPDSLTSKLSESIRFETIRRKNPGDENNFPRSGEGRGAEMKLCSHAFKVVRSSFAKQTLWKVSTSSHLFMIAHFMSG